jgi:glycosyltransferase involved in cell wall biosynthesis
MKLSVITANYNGSRFLEKSIVSVLNQAGDVDLEYIMIDGCSTDSSAEIIKKYRSSFTHCVVEKDSGPAEAINKGLRLAEGDIVAWLNSDDQYCPQALLRVCQALKDDQAASMCFGHCRIIDENDREIRSFISRFKELFFPISSRFTYQCINYISQPALFFRGEAVRSAGSLREDMQAAWDYEFVLRLWRCGYARYLPGPPLASFRWHPGSISGSSYHTQFKEEYEAAKKDAGRYSMQTILHFFVRWAIVSAYAAMTKPVGRF